MVSIQVILVGAFLVLLIVVLSAPEGYRINFWKKFLVAGFICFAMLAILYPNILSRMAHTVGVGRGADLLLYVVTLSFIFWVLNSYMQLKKRDAQFARIVRRLAIIEASLDTQKKHNKG